MKYCHLCNKTLNIEALKCSDCSIEYRGKFHTSPLMMLPEQEQHLVEMLILHGGSLKDIAKAMHISYPTLKKRLMQLSDTYTHLQHNKHL